MVAQAKQLTPIATNVNSAVTGIGPAVALFQTPGGPGGAGRDVIVNVSPLAANEVITFQGNPGNVNKTVPTSGDAGWVTLATFTGGAALGAESPTQALVACPAFGRYNITTAGAAGSLLNMNVQGVQ